MELIVYSLDGKQVGSLNVADEILNTPLYPFLIKDAVVAYRASLRQGTHSTKTTSEVSGSTRKLYKQKGTGNARAGSKKAVQRRGGATQFGPRPREYNLKINKKSLQKALLSAFAEGYRKEKLVVVDELKLSAPKSAKIKEFLKQWKADKALMIDNTGFDDNFRLSARNFGSVKLTNQMHINVYDLLKFNKIFITQQAIESFCSRFQK